MALYKQITLTGTGSELNSDPYPVNWRANPFNASLKLHTSGSTTGFTVQYTMDDPNNFASASDYNTSATWTSHPYMTSLTSDTDGNLAFSIRAVRLQADTNGTDTAVLTYIQGTQGA